MINQETYDFVIFLYQPVALTILIILVIKLLFVSTSDLNVTIDSDKMDKSIQELRNELQSVTTKMSNVTFALGEQARQFKAKKKEEKKPLKEKVVKITKRDKGVITETYLDGSKKRK